MRNILLVEDNLADGQFIKQTFSEINKNVNIIEINNPESAIDYMKTNINNQNPILPDLIIIDITSSCLTLLDFRKFNNTLRRIPIIILTYTNDQEYINNRYLLFANAVIIKPKEKERFKEIINEIDNFWFHRTRLSSIPK
jgi:two-component system, chemotaxis family, response regulator Rcp1